MVEFKYLMKKIFTSILFYAEKIILFMCYLFLSVLLCLILYGAIMLIKNDIVVRYYALGILVILSASLSLAFISKYNKKYKKNSSNSFERQNDLFFEEDIRE